jgi:hypothetical protein
MKIFFNLVTFAKQRCSGYFFSLHDDSICSAYFTILLTINLVTGLSIRIKSSVPARRRLQSNLHFLTNLPEPYLHNMS